jgi:hypothetical protein
LTYSFLGSRAHIVDIIDRPIDLALEHLLASADQFFFHFPGFFREPGIFLINPEIPQNQKGSQKDQGDISEKALGNASGVFHDRAFESL